MKVLRLLLSVGVLFALTQCKKPEEKSGDQIKPMTELNVPPTFDWKMAHPVNVHITGSSGTEVKVTSTDGLVTFYKCRIKPGTNSVDIPLSIPDVVREVLINGITVPITGPNVQVNLPALKDILLDNYCLFFDLSDYLNLGDITELNNASAFTIEGWAVQPDVDLPATKTLFNKSALGFNDIRVYTNGGTLYIHLGNGSDSYATYANYSTEIFDNNWYHWAVVYDGTGITNADRLKLYLNGNSIEKVLAFTGTIPATTSPTLAGENAYLSYPWEPWAGYMDEVRIWSVARTGAEIATTYNKLIVGSTANLIACWRMDEATGTTAYDETSHNYDAFIHMCTWIEYANVWDSDGDGVTDMNDDYVFDATRAYNNYQPADDYGTLVFEDIWPNYGDYDFNDLVLGYRFKTVTNASNEVVEIYATFIARANGAALHNGFGFELPNADAGILTNVEVTGYSHTQGIITIDGTTHLETGQTNPVVIAFDDTYDLMPGICNTINGGVAADEDSVVIYIEVTGGGPFDAADFSLATWNPFLFIEQTRGRELHLLDYTPTGLMNTDYFGTGDDASVPATNDYYKSASLLPWALDFPFSFSWATEYNAINTAYLHFTEWAESGGVSYPDWYINTDAGYRNETNIYTP